MLRILRRFWNWILSWFASEPVQTLPPIRFADIEYAEKPPKNRDIQANQLIVVKPRGKLKWVLFRCPCECGEVITLSLQQVHNPHWLLQEKDNRATLHPSVWQKTPCHAHFWLRDGRIFWCEGTGNPSPFWK